MPDIPVKDFLAIAGSRVDEALAKENYTEALRLLKVALEAIEDIVNKIEARMPKREPPMDMNPGGYDGDAD